MTKESNKINVEELMAQIRSEIKSDAGKLSESVPHYVPKNSYSSNSALIHTEELNFLNEHWNNWAQQSEITSHRPVVGPIIVKIKQFFVNSIWNFVLRDYFDRERKFQMNLVKHLNNCATYIDDRIEKIFWQLVEKMDQDIKGLNERVDKLHFLAEGKAANFENQVAQELSAIKTQSEKIKSTIEAINSLGSEKRPASVIEPLVVRETLPPSWKQSISELNQTIEQVNLALNKEQ